MSDDTEGIHNDNNKTKKKIHRHRLLFHIFLVKRGASITISQLVVPLSDWIYAFMCLCVHISDIMSICAFACEPTGVFTLRRAGVCTFVCVWVCVTGYETRRVVRSCDSVCHPERAATSNSVRVVFPGRGCNTSLWLLSLSFCCRVCECASHSDSVRFLHDQLFLLPPHISNAYRTNWQWEQRERMEGWWVFYFWYSSLRKIPRRERERVEEWVLGRRREGEERVGGCREGRRES